METLLAGRAGFDMLGSQYPAAGNVQFETTSIAGVACTWVRPAGTLAGEVAVFIHGGAFIYGSLRSHAPMVSHIASALKRNVLMIDYRLAPENPFPAGLNDCVAAITGLLTEHPDLIFGIIGDSAGGNLAVAAQLGLKAAGRPMPRYSMVISPWTDLECNNDSYTRNQLADTVLTREYLQWAAGLYAGNRGRADGLVSPVNADLSGLPPALILCGTAEILEDDSIQLHRNFLAAGVEAELITFEGEQHVWPFMDIDTGASQKVLADFAIFAAKHSTSR
ncbi:Acetyl esterase/lipase [Dyadobacter sp. SG02]|uniref:alpha/beta hydrolase n=1 Tax=Dyadobacter sp. SG02 TaxID=1855291 RepID=UPI0008BDD215|nr:alpha/beta hydrolase [Dyadobacter sp. SG02]SEI54729.1 Acetyl esterase/lipase [Dyadobacter sp. SG02]